MGELAHDLAQAALPREELISYIEQIVIEARSNNFTVQTLHSEILKLQEYQDNISKSSDIATLFAVYKQIQKVSLELRKLLSRFIDLEVYDNIGYAFYYNGQRYYADQIRPEWLTKSSTTGELKLRLNAAVNDLKEEVKDTYQEKINNAFNRHYAIYLAAIKGTYRGVIGRGGAINLGHIAEAFESHTREHHPAEYRIMTSLAKSSAPLATIDKMMIAYEVETEAISYWANHEGINSAWQHIRESLGTQRGTVAGDVGRIQVKQGKTGASRIRLARFTTLIDGINAYCMIFDLRRTSYEVASIIADYISEPIRQVSEKVIGNIEDEKVQEVLKDINAKNKINIRVNI